MHKKYLENWFLFVFLFIFSFPANCQDRIPASIVNVGIGGGINYGIFGVKTVTGYKNSGLLLGLGYCPGGLLGYEIGGQISIKWFYINMGYGVFATVQEN